MNQKILLTSILLLAACTSGEHLDKVSVAVTYPADSDPTQVSALHAWVVEGTHDKAVSCNLLVAGDQEPYDVELQMHGEGGTRPGEAFTAATHKIAGVVYVVAFDYRGLQLYAGCVPAASSVTVQLELARIYNCADSTTPDGARCDDGDRCTVNDHCKTGACVGGGARDCSSLNRPCSTGVCASDKGCVRQAANEGQTCNATLFCTGPGVCANGTCVGPSIVCPPAPDQCLEGVCSEVYRKCIYVPKPVGTACDDGNPCQTGDTCGDFGTCQSGTTNRPNGSIECDGNACTIGDSCSGGTCLSGTIAANAGTSCDDKNPCTVGDHCDGTNSTTSCISTGYASSTTLCWDASSSCYLDRVCSGYGDYCTYNGDYITDFDGDGSRREAGCYGADCDDNDPNTRPGASERCGDGKDNNCDGRIDEPFCVP